MKKIAFIIAISFLIFSSNAALAEDILSIEMVLYKNNSIDFKEMALMHGLPTPYIKNGNYTLSFLSEYNKTIFELSMDVPFDLFTDPPISLNGSNVFLRIPFNPFMKYIRLSHNKETLFKALIKKCELNESCELENMEYFKNTAADISNYICNNNGICEPHSGENSINCKDCSSDNSWLPTLFAIIAVSAAAAILLHLRRKKEFRTNVAFDE